MLVLIEAKFYCIKINSFQFKVNQSTNSKSTKSLHQLSPEKVDMIAEPCVFFKYC